MARAFVAGATGLTGRHVVARLRELGHEVVAHVRPGSTRLDEWRARFGALGAEVDASAWTPEAIAGAVARARPQLVFALLGTTQARIRAARARGAAEEALGYAEVDVGMTRMLYDAARNATPPPRFVYLSSAGAGSPGKGAYLDARTEVETFVRAGPLPYTIVRPSFIVGDRDDSRAMERTLVPVAEGALRALGAIGLSRFSARHRAIEGEVLAKELVRLALDPAFAGHVVERDELA